MSTGLKFQSCTNIFERIENLKLPVGEYAVFGSALMDVWGIRPAKDLDIIITPDYFKILKDKREWKLVSANGFEILRLGEANITTVQDRPTDGDYHPDRRKLIRDAVVIQGIPFVRIEEVIACKAAYNRDKDRNDINKINAYLANHENPY